MTTEQDLNSPDFTGNATSAIGAVAVTQAAKGMSGWQRKLMLVFAAIIVLVTALGSIDKLVHWNSLPGCDDQRTRDTLSDLNKANKVNASAYNFIKEVSTSETEIRCTANLALRGGGALEYDYRIYKDGGDIKVQITSSRTP